MKNFLKILFFVLFINLAALAKAGSTPTPETGNSNGSNSDTTVGIKNNIIIFKIISPPVMPSKSNEGTLKKAGKIARTSYSHTMLDSIFYKNIGI